MMACAAMAASMPFTACSSDDNGDDPTPPAETEELKGTITGNKTLNANTEYTLIGSLVIENGGTLTIPAGTTIKVRPGFASYVLVARGGKINARGTATQPITFKADTEDAGSGYWGGIILNGRAPISGAADSGNEGATEINNDYKYGGSDAADNSGVLAYVRILNSGARNTGDIEHNGLTLNAVGNGTTIENIYIADGADDAIEFFGGSVNVTNLLAINCEDDMFDFTQGYNGTLKNCYGIWETGFLTDEADPRGVEADGNLDGNGPDHKHQSDFRIENMTIENRSTTAEMQDVIKVRRGAKATIVNALVKGNGSTIDLVDMTDKKGAGSADSHISLTNGLTNAITGSEVNGSAQITIAPSNAGTSSSLFGWTGYTLF